jgi:hypothetical protein
MVAEYPELDRAGVDWSVDKYTEFWSSEQPKKGGLLSFTPGMWESTKQVLLDAKLVEDIDITPMITTDYLPNPPITP